MRISLAIGLACAMLVSALAVDAGNVSAVRKTIESSMLVTGSIDIGTDGTVIAHRIDQPEKLPPFVRDLVAKGVPQFRFEPVTVAGKVVKARTTMSVRVIAKKLKDGNYGLRLGSASFGESGGAKGEHVSSIEMTPPRYPPSAYMSGVQGTVYLVVKVGRDGKVIDAMDEKVNLTVLGTEQQMHRARAALAKAAVAKGRQWRFQPPTQGPRVADEFWSVRVPVSFALCDSRSECGKTMEPAYGTWETYVPGPKKSVPWLSDEQNRHNPDAMVAGTAQPVGSGPKLLTPLGQG